MELSELIEVLGFKDRKTQTVTIVGLKSVEGGLNIAFPADYFDQVVAVGLPSTVEILDVIVDRELPLHDLWSLYSPTEILSETRNWHSIGLPENLVAIGSDCMGNMFCFDISEMTNIRQPKAAVYFWDHDFDETTKVASSFSEWISQYTAILK